MLVGECDVELWLFVLCDFWQCLVVGFYCKCYCYLFGFQKCLVVVGVDVYEVDVQLFDCYVMECFIIVCVEFCGQFGCDGMLIGGELKLVIGYCFVLCCVLFDIEISVYGELYLIVFEGCGQCQVYMFGLLNGDECDSIGMFDFNFDYCDSWFVMFVWLNDWFDEYDFDVVIGWNFVQFDLCILYVYVE